MKKREDALWSHDDAVLRPNLEPSYFGEDEIFKIRDTPLSAIRIVAEKCPLDKCRCCASSYSQLVRHHAMPLTIEMLEKAPSPAWKQLLAKTAILAKLDRENT